MTTRTQDRTTEAREYGQQIMDKLVAETSSVETVRSETNKDKYIRILESKIEQLKSIIDDMAEKSKDLEKGVKAEFEKESEMVHLRYVEARTRLSEIRQSGGDAWKELQHGAIRAWQDLAEGIENAVAKFR